MRFSGSQNLNINAGGRITIPTKYRNDINSDEKKGLMYLTSHLFDKCLVLYPGSKFEDLAKQISEVEDTSQAEVFRKIIIGPAVETEMDSQGRIMIPPSLRAVAGIDKEVTLVGQNESIQLWDSSEYVDDFDDAREKAKALLKNGDVRLKL